MPVEKSQVIIVIFKGPGETEFKTEDLGNMPRSHHTGRLFKGKA